jgi:hypothetical protein
MRQGGQRRAWNDEGWDRQEEEEEKEEQQRQSTGGKWREAGRTTTCVERGRADNDARVVDLLRGRRRRCQLDMTSK